MSSERRDIAQRFAQLFRCASYGTDESGDFVAVDHIRHTGWLRDGGKRVVTLHWRPDLDDFESHLYGNGTRERPCGLGIGPGFPDEAGEFVTWVACPEIDTPDHGPLDDAAILEISRRLKAHRIPHVLTQSTGGSAHPWLIFPEPLQAAEAKHRAELVAAVCRFEDIEGCAGVDKVFPAQVQLRVSRRAVLAGPKDDARPVLDRDGQPIRAAFYGLSRVFLPLSADRLRPMLVCHHSAGTVTRVHDVEMFLEAARNAAREPWPKLEVEEPEPPRKSSGIDLTRYTGEKRGPSNRELTDADFEVPQGARFETITNFGLYWLDKYPPRPAEPRKTYIEAAVAALEPLLTPKASGGHYVGPSSDPDTLDRYIATAEEWIGQQFDANRPAEKLSDPPPEHVSALALERSELVAGVPVAAGAAAAIQQAKDVAQRVRSADLSESDLFDLEAVFRLAWGRDFQTLWPRYVRPAIARTPEREAAGELTVRVTPEYLEPIRAEMLSGLDYVATPWPSLNRQVYGKAGQSGLAHGTHAAFAAASGVGKSTVARTFIAHALRHGEHVLLWNLEGDMEDLFARFAALHLETHIREVTRGRHFDIEKHATGCKLLTDAPGELFVNTRFVYDIARIVSEARELMKSEGVRTLVLDHMQLTASGDDEQLVKRIADMVNQLADLSTTENVLTVGLSQLHRAAAGDYTRCPGKHSLWGGNALESAASQILLVDHCSKHTKQSAHANTTERRLILAKNRSGPERPFQVVFDWDTGRVAETYSGFAESDEPEPGVPEPKEPDRKPRQIAAL